MHYKLSFGSQELCIEAFCMYCVHIQSPLVYVLVAHGISSMSVSSTVVAF